MSFHFILFYFFLSIFSWLLTKWYPPALCTCSCSPCFNEFAVLMNLGHISHYFCPLCQGCDWRYYALPFDDFLWCIMYLHCWLFGFNFCTTLTINILSLSLSLSLNAVLPYSLSLRCMFETGDQVTSIELKVHGAQCYPTAWPSIHVYMLCVTCTWYSLWVNSGFIHEAQCDPAPGLYFLVMTWTDMTKRYW